MSKNELNFEEISLIENPEEDYLELPLSRQTFLLAGAAVSLVMLIFFVRMVFVNLVQGHEYQNRALSNANKEINIPAPRGAIIDRFGQQLAGNKSSFSVFVNSTELLKLLKAQKLDWDIFLSNLGETLSLDAGKLAEQLRRANLEKNSLMAVARNISSDQMIALRGLNLPAVQISDDYVRNYIDGPVFSHIVGYTGLSDINSDIVGKDGLENTYDSYLRGEDGSKILYRDARGEVLDQKVIKDAQLGNQLELTVDADLQRFFYSRFQKMLSTLGRDSGAGLAINPQNGEILALISLPSFDNNKVKEYLNSPSQPLFNRVVSGVYTPGSTIKPLVALAALKENLVKPEFQVFSAGFIELPNPFNPELPSRFLDWKPHGWVNLHSALARSSNVYFYSIGGGFQDIKGLGIEKLKEYWKKFLFGEKTGIDLPSENEGFLPDPEEKEKRTGQIWRIGDTYNISIGQGDLMVTPLQLLNFISSIANGGKFYKPTLTKFAGKQPEIVSDYSDWQAEIREVQKGMEDAVQKYYGTASLLSYLPIKSAGKTGSSQVANNTRTNAFFVGYMPAENPQIALLVLIENSREGSLNAVPVAKDVMEWYYYNRIATKPLSN
ncbi:MAG: penicillin-binding protein 2 [Patescibacteria group bacterium]